VDVIIVGGFSEVREPQPGVLARAASVGMEWVVSCVQVKSDGLVDLELLKEAIRPETVLVSIMAVNNEIGALLKLCTSPNLCPIRRTWYDFRVAGFSRIP
jgi:cysteine sulfinate desulfinase/cysteine desulfurase-like protein